MSGPASTSTDGLALATRELHKSYGSQVALAGLDLSVPSGVVYGFLGPNGAGKTTTMRLLTGLIRPDAGRIELLGRPFGRRDRHRLFEVGALIETPAFYPYLSARENLRALAATGAPVRRGRIEEVLDLMGLRARAGDAVGGYSLGMRQRLGIAATLLNDPRLLLLDEPANGLDPAGIVAMRDTLRYLASSGKTVFVSSHILGEVEQLADVVGIVAGGRLIREGPIEELLESEGVVRVRVADDEIPAATAILARIAHGTEAPTGVPTTGGDPTADGGPTPGGGPAADELRADDGGWLTLRVGRERASEVNRVLAEAGIYASGLETGSDLETFFLELTAGASMSGAATASATHATPLPTGWGTHR